MKLPVETISAVVIVGAGAAGVSAAATLRSEGFDGRIVLIGAEPEEPYRRPTVTKEILRGDKNPDSVRLKPPGFYAAKDIELRLGHTAVDLDVATREITFDDGSQLRYDKLLIATGGRPRMLPGVSGVDVDGMHTLRGLGDVPRLRKALLPGAALVVIGAGFIGAEVAASARTLGCSVTVLEAAPTPLSRILPPAVADFYTRLHTSHGVDLHLNVGLASVRRDGDTVTVEGTDGLSYSGDAVVLGVGMVPNIDLAVRAGLTVDDGILVDELCRTSIPEIFAAGDVAAHPDPLTDRHRRVEHWQNAMNQGAAAARAMLGGQAPFREVPWFWSDQYGVNLQVCGSPAADDEVRVRGDLDGSAFTAVCRRDGRLSGAIGVNSAKDVRALRRLVLDAPDTDLDVLADPDVDLAGL